MTIRITGSDIGFLDASKTLTPLHILCLVDGPVVPPDKWIWNWLPAEAQTDAVDFLHVSPPDLFPAWGKVFTYYPAYLALAVRAIRQARSHRYDAIVAWESKFGFPLAAFRSLLRIQTPPLVILAFSFKGITSHFTRLSRLAVSGIDHATVLSPTEPAYYSRLLNMAPQKLSFCPLGWHDMFTDLRSSSCVKSHEGSNDTPDESYVFASGRSYRDYDTLFAAVSGLDSHFVVNARKFNVHHLERMSNITINEFMSEPEFAKLMYGARFVILPLKKTLHAAGEGHVIQAMAAGKALVATRTASTEYYVEDGKTGILVESHNRQAMRAAIEYLLCHPDETAMMGCRARRRYEEQFTAEIAYTRVYERLRQVVASGFRN